MSTTLIRSHRDRLRLISRALPSIFGPTTDKNRDVGGQVSSPEYCLSFESVLLYENNVKVDKEQPRAATMVSSVEQEILPILPLLHPRRC